MKVESLVHPSKRAPTRTGARRTVTGQARSSHLNMYDEQMKFSIVIPVKDEVDLLMKTLPSYYAVNPSEVLICTDKPALEVVKTAINRVATSLNAENITKIIEVDRDSEWRFHQAHVRREGFHKAKYDRILTGDIDLAINDNILKALKLIGKGDVGLVSLSKLRYPRNLKDVWALFATTFLRNVVHRMLNLINVTTTFSGLYALWKPYWLDSEPEDEIKRMVNPKQIYRGEKPNLVGATAITGEDIFLRDCMLRKYKCLYLRDIGAIDLGVAIEDLPYIQYMKGQSFALRGRSLPVSLGRAILRAQPYYLMGHLAVTRARASTNIITVE